MTYKENVTAILECNFAGFKQEIIDIAVDCIMTLSENNREWIPISSINEIPKEGAYWVTFEYENGHRETSHIGWDKFHERWDDEEGWALEDEDYIIAYMPYFEPEPYNPKSE